MSTVLITGCSSGIGEATATRIRRAGHTVYATARKPESLTALADLGCKTLPLDVTDEASMSAAVAAITDQHGAVDVLINNAGYGQYGPIEQVSIDDVRRQFETNVFGAIRLTQLVLPAMRAQRRGRIISVSSMGGRTTLPGGGIYHASKYAMESINDALRIEVRPFGIQVVLIEPGVVRTAWSDIAMEHQNATESEADPYAAYNAAVAQSFDRAYTGPLAKLSITADQVAKVIAKATDAARPRPRYLISPMAKSLVAAKTMLPDRAHDLLLKQQYKLP